MSSASSPPFEGDVDTEVSAWLAAVEVGDSTGSAGTSALRSFHGRVGGYRQLSAPDQAKLVALYQRGKWATGQLSDQGQLSLTEIAQLKEMRRQGTKAAELLTGSNYKLISLICREKAQHRFGKEGATAVLPDLIAEANVALLEAAEKFDTKSTTKFPTYLAGVVRNRVLLILSREGPGSMIRVPPSWLRTKRYAVVARSELSAELGREPSIDELRARTLAMAVQWAYKHLTEAEEALGPEEQKEAVMAKLRKHGTLGAIDHLDQVLNRTMTMPSLNAPVGDDPNSEAQEAFVASDDPFGENPSEQVERFELIDAVRAAVASLGERERTIIGHRYGFIDGDMWTYAQISEMFDVTPERIRQIEKGVLARLSSPHGDFAFLSNYL